MTLLYNTPISIKNSFLFFKYIVKDQMVLYLTLTIYSRKKNSYVPRHWVLRESTMRFIHCSICIYDVQVSLRHLNPVYEINRILYGKKRVYTLYLLLSSQPITMIQGRRTNGHVVVLQIHTLLHINCTY